MTGLPTVQVLLDDGTGTYPYDVSGFVRLSTPLNVTRGWADENGDDAIQPGQVSLRLDNLDGRFTLGASLYGIRKGQGLRFRETIGGTTFTRFTGFVNDWPTQWESALGNVAYAQVTVVDRLARFNRATLRSVLDEEALVEPGLAALYPLTEAAGSSSAGDVSSRGAAPLVPVQVPAPVFAATPGPGVEATPVVAFTADAGYLESPIKIVSSTTARLSLEVWANISALSSTGPQAFVGLLQTLPGVSTATFVGMRVEKATGLPWFVGLSGQTSGPASIVDGKWHHLVMAWSSSATACACYVDGVSVGAFADGTVMPDFSRLMVGRNVTVPTTLYSSGATGAGFTGAVAGVAAYVDTLSAGRVKAHAVAGLDGGAGLAEAADARVTRLVTYGGVAAADVVAEAGEQGPLLPSLTTGQSLQDALADVTHAEAGAVFVAGDGRVVMHAKGHRVRKAMGTPALTLTADQLVPDDLEFAADNYLLNVATGGRRGGAEQRLVNAASVAKYGEYPTSRDNTLLPSDGLVLDELTWITNRYAEPLARLPTATLDLLTLPVAVVQAALALEIGDLIRVSGWPTQAPAASLDLIVEGLKETQTLSDRSAAWTLTLNTAPASLFQAPIYDTASATVDSGLPVYF